MKECKKALQEGMQKWLRESSHKEMQGAPMGDIAQECIRGVHRGLQQGESLLEASTDKEAHEGVQEGGCTCCCSGQEPGIGWVEDIQDAVHHVWHQGRPAQLKP